MTNSVREFWRIVIETSLVANFVEAETCELSHSRCRMPAAHGNDAIVNQKRCLKRNDLEEIKHPVISVIDTERIAADSVDSDDAVTGTGERRSERLYKKGEGSNKIGRLSN